MVLSFVANVGAVVVDLTPDYAKPGDTVQILSFEIFGPVDGTTLTSVYVTYTGTDPADVKSAEILVDGNPFGTYTGDFVPPCIIPSSDPGGYPLPESGVVVTLRLKLMDSAVDGNLVDGKISAYTTGDPWGAGTDEAPIDPAGDTIIARAHRLEITSTPLDLTAGTSGTMTVEIQHESGTPLQAGEYVVNLESSASSGKYYFYEEGTMINPITSITIADGVSYGTFDYYDEEAGTPTITVSDADAILLPDEQVQTVNPAALHHLIIEGEPSITMAGEPFPAPIVVTAYDVFGNVKTDYTGTVHFDSTDSQADLPVDYPFNGDEGVHSFDGSEFVLYTAGTWTITVSDGVISDTTGDILVNPAPASKLVFTATPTSTTAGDEVGPFTVQRLDPYDNLVTSGVLDVELASTSDGVAAEFRAISGGSPVIDVTILDTESTVDFYYYDEKAGEWTIMASAGILSVDTVLTVNPAVAFDLMITSDPLELTAGTSGTMTVEIQDTFGNAQPDGEYVVNLASDSSAHLFYTTGTTDEITSITIPNGESSGTFDYYDERVGTPMITVDDGLNSDSQAQTVNIGILDHITIEGEPSTMVAGTQFPAPIVVTAYDEFNNVKTDYVGTVHFSSTDSQADLPVDYTFNGDAGDHEFAGTNFVLKTAGTQTITVADGLVSATTGDITVNPEEAYALVITSESLVLTAGTSGTMTVQVQDEFGNAQPVGEYYVDLASDSSAHLFYTTGTSTVITSITIADEASSGTFDYYDEKVGTPTITVSDSGEVLELDEQIQTVNPAALNSLTITGEPSTTVAGTQFPAPIVITAYDEFDNVKTDYEGTVTFTSTDINAVLPVPYPFLESENGVHSFAGSEFVLKTAGTQTITVSDGVSATTGDILVEPAVLDSFTIEGEPEDIVAGAPFPDLIVVTAYDMFDNVKTDYTGEVTFTSTDPTAILPGDYTFTLGDAGDHEFTGSEFVLYTAGTQTITVSNGAISTTDDILVEPAVLYSFTITGEPDVIVAGTPFTDPIVVTAYDEFYNVKTGYVGTVHFYSTDIEADLPGDYTFTLGDAGDHEFAGSEFVLKTAGTQTITVWNGPISATTGDITVNPEAAYALKITSEPLMMTAGTSGTMTVEVQDQYGNPQSADEYVVDLASSSSGIYYFYATGTTTSITSITIAEGVSSGTFDYNDEKVGTPTITVSDGLISDSQEQTVNPDDAIKLQILVPGETAAPGTVIGKTGSPTAQEVGQPFDVVVNAVDEYWNINPAGLATVDITTTDPNDIEPAQADLVDGTETFSVTLLTMGEWTITATDIDLVSLLADTSPPITVNPGPATHLHVYGITDPVTAGDDSGVTVEAMDEFDNRATSYLGTIQFASSDTGTVTTLPGEYTFTAGDAGIKVFDGVTMDQIVKLTTAGEHWVSAIDNAYIEYSYSTTIPIDGSQSPLELTVIDDGTWVTWTFDFPVEEFTGDGNLNVGLIIALDGEGEGPAFQIHNNDGATTVSPHGTWMYGSWGPAIDTPGTWYGWPNHELDVNVTDLDWVEASGDRKGQGTDGVLQIKIDRAVLGNEFHWAASPTVGSGFWGVYDDTMQVPSAFGWSTPIVDMAVPNYVHRSSIWGEQTEITVEPADPAYVDVIASFASVEGSSIIVLVGDEAMITATVTDEFGNFVPETEVSFETDLVTGTIWPPTDETENGIAQTSIFSTDVGTATVTATAGSVSGFCTITFIEQTLEIQLGLGWNLVSVPRTLANPAIEEVFAGTTTVEKVYTYHEGKWYAAFYDNGLWTYPTLNKLEQIADGNGYWVYTSEPNEVTIKLKPLGYMETPPSYPLPADWSLIGYTSIQLNPQMSIDNYLGYLTWNTLYRFDPYTRMYEIAKPDLFGFADTELGRGYWIHLNAAGDLVP